MDFLFFFISLFLFVEYEQIKLHAVIRSLQVCLLLLFGTIGIHCFPRGKKMPKMDISIPGNI